MIDNTLWDKINACHGNKERKDLEKEGCIFIEGNSKEDVLNKVKEKYHVEIADFTNSNGFEEYRLGDSFLYRLIHPLTKKVVGLLEVNNWEGHTNTPWEGILVISEKEAIK